MYGKVLVEIPVAYVSMQTKAGIYDLWGFFQVTESSRNHIVALVESQEGKFEHVPISWVRRVKDEVRVQERTEDTPEEVTSETPEDGTGRGSVVRPGTRENEGCCGLCEREAFTGPTIESLSGRSNISAGDVGGRDTTRPKHPIYLAGPGRFEYRQIKVDEEQPTGELDPGNKL